MKINKFIFLAVLFAFSNFSSSTNSHEIEYYIGDWLYFSNSEFLLIEIKGADDILLNEYINRELAFGEKNPDEKHFYYKSKGWIKNINNNGLSIQTDKYRFDFIFRSDTLILFEEVGEWWKLIRLKPEKLLC